MSRPSRVAAAALAAIALLVSSCSASPEAQGGDRSAGARAGFPHTIQAPNGPVTIDRRPEAIVSLSPTATEMLFAIDAGEQVIAVDDQSDYPPEAPVTDLSGFEPNIEAIASYDPDLVVVSDTTPELEEGLGALAIPMLWQPAATTLEDTYVQIEQLGRATGNEAAAEELGASMERRIEEITESAPAFEEPPTYYHELDPSYFTATSDTFIGEIYSLVGLRNIADAADDGSGYPQLSAEFIIDADPDLIFLADAECCDQTADVLAERPGWDRIAAVRRGSVVELDEDVASRWGPRVVEFLETAAGAAASLEDAA
jgi:iron complex transport system substrate-binding protein